MRKPQPNPFQLCTRATVVNAVLGSDNQLWTNCGSPSCTSIRLIIFAPSTSLMIKRQAIPTTISESTGGIKNTVR